MAVRLANWGFGSSGSFWVNHGRVSQHHSSGSRVCCLFARKNAAGLYVFTLFVSAKLFRGHRTLWVVRVAPGLTPRRLRRRNLPGVPPKCEGISPHSAPEWLWAKIECNLARTWLRLGGWLAWDARGAVRRLRGSRGATVVIQTCFVCSAWLLVLCAEIFHEYFRL